MNWYEGFIRTTPQKLRGFSANGLTSMVLATLSICVLSLACHAQQVEKDRFYLEHSLLVNRHFTDVNPINSNVQSRSLENTFQSNIKHYGLEDADPYYFNFNSDSCHIDPFTSKENAVENKQLLATCLRSQLWENDNIPLWIKATGATLLIGVAGNAGKVDDDLKFKVGFDQMDAILRDWLSKEDP